MVAKKKEYDDDVNVCIAFLCRLSRYKGKTDAVNDDITSCIVVTAIHCDDCYDSRSSWSSPVARGYGGLAEDSGQQMVAASLHVQRNSIRSTVSEHCRCPCRCANIIIQYFQL